MELKWGISDLGDVLFMLYLLSICFSIWLMDVSNSKSMWHCEQGDYVMFVFRSIVCIFPIVNILWTIFISERWTKNK